MKAPAFITLWVLGACSASNSPELPDGVSAGSPAAEGAGGGLGGARSTGGSAGARASGGAGPSLGGAGHADGGASSGGPGGMGPSASGGAGGANGAGGASAGGSGGGLIGGYMTFGAWHGFAWTAVNSPDSSIVPGDFGDVTAPPLCAVGTVAPGTGNVALLGVNLNQATTAGALPGVVVPGRDGVTVRVTNRGTSPLRVQIQGPNGETDENDRWCAPVSGSGGFIPWNAFNTRCWNGTGRTYDGRAITALMLLVPGGAGPVAFDVCLDDLVETSGPIDPGGGGCSLTGDPGEGTGALVDPFDWTRVTRGGRDYVVQNNVWGGSAGQALSYDGVSFRVTAQPANNATNGPPVSYPSVFIGANNTRTTPGSNLPKQVSALTSVATGWSWSGSADGVYNASYDVWFSTGANGDPTDPSGGYLMVWLHKPDGAQPIGENRATVNLAGGTWNVWMNGSQLGHPIISYTRTQSTNSMSFDLNDFIRDAVDRGVIQSGWFLTNVFAGFEIWSGGVGLVTNEFCATVN